MSSLSNKLVSVVIVTVGTGEYIFSLLETVLYQSYQNIEIIIIDNSKKTEIGFKIKKLYPKVFLYTLIDRLSYCDSLNKAIASCGGDFILCLNDDVKLDKDFIINALQGFELAGKVGMVSGKVLRFDGRVLDSAGLTLSIFRTAKERGYGKIDRRQFNKRNFIFGVNGAVAFYRRSMLEQIKVEDEYFDSDFGFFYEDLDLSWRAQNFGWKGYYIPEAVAYHARGASVRANGQINRKYARRFLSDGLYFDLVKNRYLTVIKNETLFNFILHLPFIVLYDTVCFFYTLLFRFSFFSGLEFKELKVFSALKKRDVLRKIIAGLK